MKQVIGLVVARRLLAFVATCLLAAGGAAQEPADQGFEPFDVYVDQQEVMARCGPGGEYYRTDPLRHGQRLEVYLETDQGWLGVRPPEGSFSWVPADAVELDRGGKIGKVTEEGTLSWIGTHLGKARKYMWQVQLAAGETVTILGKAEREGPDGPQLWYRIAPPAGEFRWVHREQVVDNPESLLRDKPQRDDRVAQSGLTLSAPESTETTRPESVAASSDRSPRSILRPRGGGSMGASDPYASPPSPSAADVPLTTLDAPEAIPLGDQTPLANWPVRESPSIDPLTAVRFLAAGALGRAPSGDAASDAAAPERSQATAATRPLPLPPQPSSFTQPVGSGVARAIQPPLVSIASEPTVRAIGGAGWGDASAVQPASGSEWVSANPRLPATVSSPELPTGVQPSDYRHLSLDALQLELSRRMVASARVADVEGLRLAADHLVATAASETDRQRATHLAQRVRQYQSIASRRDGEPLPLPELSAGSGNVIPAVAMAPPPGQVHFAGAAANPPEVSGYLVQVYSARPESPPFALTDASGRTTHYVSPTPGFNLRRFLNQHVIIAGQAGYDTGLDTPHIIASTAVRSPEPR